MHEVVCVHVAKHLTPVDDHMRAGPSIRREVFSIFPDLQMLYGLYIQGQTMKPQCVNSVSPRMSWWIMEQASGGQITAQSFHDTPVAFFFCP